MFFIKIEFLGSEISRIRRRMGMSQKQLSENICTQSTISRIEAGEVYPTIDILVNISSRLKVPIEYFIEMLFQPNVAENELFINEVEALLKQHQYNKILEMVKNFHADTKNVWLSLYKKYLFYTSKYYLKKIDYISLIKSLKEISLSTFYSTVQFEFLNIKILNTIGNVLGENGDPSKSIYYYNRILKDYNDKSFYNRRNYEHILIVLYNKSKTLYDMNKLKESLEVIDLGIKMSKESSIILLTGQFLYYKGQCLEKMDVAFEGIQRTYQEALFIFEFLELTFYVNTIKKNKSVFLNL